MRKNIIKVIAAMSISMSLAGIAFSADHTPDTTDVVKANLADNSAVLVDVRETSEWQAGHLQNAINVPLSDIQAGRTAALPVGKTLYLHCQSGRRVLIAADLLKDAKFLDVRPLLLGYPDLLKQGFNPAK